MDVFDRIRDDHRRARKLLADIEAEPSPEKAGALFDTLDVELTLHADAEEDAFYPVASQVVGEAGLVSQAQDEHLATRHLLAELRQETWKKPEFKDKIHQLHDTVEQHFKEEENSLLPQMAHELNDSAIEDLDKHFCEAKARRLREITGNRLKEVTTLDITSMKPR